MIKKISPAILVGLLSTLPLFYWYYQNQSYPYIDAADYLKPVMHAYLDFVNNGLWAGLQSSFTIRLWKPIFFPLLAFPSLALTGNKILLSVALTMLVIQLLIGCYVFLFFNRYHSKVWSAFLAMLVMSVPLFINNGNKFYTESAFALCALAVFYHGERLIKSWDSRAIAASLGWATLAVLIRPVEAVVMLGPGMALVAWMGWKKKYLSITSLSLIFFIIACETSLLVLAFFEKAVLYPWFYRFCFFLPLVLLAVGFKEFFVQKKNIFSLLLGLSMSLVAFWYVPYAGSLVNWVYQCTFGEMAVRTGGRKVGDWIPYLGGIFRDLSGNVMVLMAVSAMILQGPRLLLRLPIIWLAAILPTLIIGFMTHNSLSRYYSAPALLIFCLMGAYITRPTDWKKIIIHPLLAFGLILNLKGLQIGLDDGHQVESFWHSLFISRVESPGKYDDYGSYYQQMKKFIGEDPEVRHTSTLLLQPRVKDIGRQMPDPWSLGILSHQDGSYNDYFFGHTDAAKPSEDQLLDLHCFAEYVIVGPLDGTQDKIWNGGSELGVKIIEAWKNDKLIEMNFDNAAIMRSRFDRGTELQFLMLKTKPEFYGCQNRLSSRYKAKMFD